jgi:hypothetical protein
LRSTSTSANYSPPPAKSSVQPTRKTGTEVELLATTLQLLVGRNPELAKRVLQLCLAFVINAADSVQ